MWIHINTHVCIHIHINTYIYLYINICIHMYVWQFPFIIPQSRNPTTKSNSMLRIHIKCKSKFAPRNLIRRNLRCSSRWFYIFINIYVYTYIYIYIYTHLHIYIYMLISSMYTIYVQIYISNLDEYIHINMHISIHVHVCMHRHICI